MDASSTQAVLEFKMSLQGQTNVNIVPFFSHLRAKLLEAFQCSKTIFAVSIGMLKLCDGIVK